MLNWIGETESDNLYQLPAESQAALTDCVKQFPLVSCKFNPQTCRPFYVTNPESTALFHKIRASFAKL